MNAPGDIQLQPPGSGLPLPELLVARAGFWFGRQLMTRAQALKIFLAEADTIRRLAESLAPADAARPVLIPRVLGIEDSSRCWSVFMTVEHLVIVDSGITSTLNLLTAGKTPSTPSSTAAVKPKPVHDPEVRQRFSDTVARYTETLAGLSSLRTRARYTHPWFGSLDAHGWHCVAAVHHTIHRRQIERIIQLLPQT